MSPSSPATGSTPTPSPAPSPAVLAAMRAAITARRDESRATHPWPCLCDDCARAVDTAGSVAPDGDAQGSLSASGDTDRARLDAALALADRILNALDALQDRFHDLGPEAEADRRTISRRYAALKHASYDFTSASRLARTEFVVGVLRRPARVAPITRTPT